MVMTPDDLRIEPDTSRGVSDVLVRLGRVEDATFSPSNDRLALACLDRNTIAVAELAITGHSDVPAVAISRIEEFSSPTFHSPHGVDFVDDEHLMVANRYGRVDAVRVPRRPTSSSSSEPVPLTPMDLDSFDVLKRPGAIRIVRSATGRTEALVCDNKRSVVTKHALLLAPLRVASSQLLLRRLLDFPDGIAVSRDEEWIAIANHDAHVVLVYHWSASLAEGSEPDAVLRGTIYPHGLQFTPDGRRLIVADSGRPYVNIYERHGDSWSGVGYPDACLQVMSDEIYALGRDHESRGPKGVAIDDSGRVLTVTFERCPMAFFDLAIALDRHASCGGANDLRYELEVMEEAGARLDQAESRLVNSRSFRLTKPLRMLNTARKSLRH